jgi:hypothetical protein
LARPPQRQHQIEPGEDWIAFFHPRRIRGALRGMDVQRGYVATLCSKAGSSDCIAARSDAVLEGNATVIETCLRPEGEARHGSRTPTNVIGSTHAHNGKRRSVYRSVNECACNCRYAQCTAGGAEV